MGKEIEIFCCYAHEDQDLLEKLETYFTPLKREGLISIWYDAYLSPGAEWDKEISEHLNTADIILLLISPDFMASEYCHEKEMKRAMERHELRDARVIPVLLKQAHWQTALFGKLQVLPSNAQPVMSNRWHTQDDALFDVAEGIRRIAKKLQERSSSRLLTPLREVSIPRRASIPQRTAQAYKPPTQTLKQGQGVSRRMFLSALGGTTLGGVVGSTLTWLVLSKSNPSSHPISTTQPVGTTFHTYHGHLDAVFAIAWSPNGDRIASGSADHTVQVWDALSGNHAFSYREHSRDTRGVAWSPDGKRIASGDVGGVVKEWSATSGTDIFPYPEHPGSAEAIAWSPNGNLFAVGRNSPNQLECVVQVWDVDARTIVQTYQGHSQGVLALAWSPDSTRIASGSWDRTVQVWDARTGYPFLTYRGHSDGVLRVTWSPDGKRIASAGKDKTVQVWDAMTGVFIISYEKHSGPVDGVTWSPDSKLIASGGQSPDNTVQIWSVTTGTHIFTYPSGSVVSWSPKGQFIASEGLDNSVVQIWQAI